MKIVFFTTAHNSLSQRAFVELVDRGHTVFVVIASSEAVMLVPWTGPSSMRTRNGASPSCKQMLKWMPELSGPGVPLP